MAKTMKPVLESNAAAPSMIVFGRGYGDDNSFSESSATERYNAMVSMFDPFRDGASNPILSTIAQFERNRDYEFQEDLEPELDEYVQTLFLTDEELNNDSYTVNGDTNPYALLDKLNEVVPQPVVKASAEPETEPGINDDFLLNFGKVFNA